MTAITPIDDGRGEGSGTQVEIVRRLFEARFLEGLLVGLAGSGHIGQFQAAGRAHVAMVGASTALDADDFLFGTARDLPAALARGIGFERVLTQVFGTAGSTELGRTLPGAISMARPGISLAGGNPAAHLVHAAGWGFAARLRQDSRVSVALFGSGAIAQADVHTAFKAAQLRDSHTIFVARGARGGELRLEEAGAAWGMRTFSVDGDSAAAVNTAVRRARARAVAGEGPTLIDARHPDTPTEAHDVKALQLSGRLSPELERSLNEEVRASLWRARESAEASARPSFETLLSHLFAESTP